MKAIFLPLLFVLGFISAINVFAQTENCAAHLRSCNPFCKRRNC